MQEGLYVIRNVEARGFVLWNIPNSFSRHILRAVPFLRVVGEDVLPAMCNCALYLAIDKYIWQSLILYWVCYHASITLDT